MYIQSEISKSVNEMCNPMRVWQIGVTNQTAAFTFGRSRSLVIVFDNERVVFQPFLVVSMQFTKLNSFFRYEDFQECFSLWCEEEPAASSTVFNTVAQHMESGMTVRPFLSSFPSHGSCPPDGICHQNRVDELLQHFNVVWTKSLEISK